MNTWTDKDIIRVYQPQVVSAAGTSGNVDLKNYDVTQGVKVEVDVTVNTAGALGVTIEQSADTTEANFATLDSTSFTAITDSTSAASLQQFTVHPTKRYLRAHLTPVTTGSFTVAVTFVAQKRYA